ncbi:MAG: acyltransferase [Proteobacteria bacterium]|nr:acyltransferase [Pseudomonadota bacterium]MBU1595647.1 acyltransferase [Pseudomonadota bacterium]
MIPRESSQRLDLIRFPLIVGIVFLHNYEAKVALSVGDMGIAQPHQLEHFVRTLISQGLARVAVPFFFLMSGYLFFAGAAFSRHVYLNKLCTRARTLLLPFLFWNLLTLAVVALAQALPATQAFLSGNSAAIAGYRPLDHVAAIFGIGRYPIAYHLWFIRDLMILVLLAPAIHYANKISAAVLLTTLAVCWLAPAWPFDAPRTDAALFFCFGAFLGSRGYDIFLFDKFWAICALLYVPLVVYHSIVPESMVPLYSRKIEVTLGMLVAMFLTKRAAAAPRVKELLLSLSGASFFVYASHEPLLTISRKVAYRYLAPESSLLSLSLYFMIPAAVIAFQLLFYRRLAACFPGFASAITGGRK